MNTPVWAEALVSCAYFALGVLSFALVSLKPAPPRKALVYSADFLIGLGAGALFIGVTELFFGGITGVAAYSAYALGIALSVLASAVAEPVKRKEKCTEPIKKCKQKCRKNLSDGMLKKRFSTRGEKRFKNVSSRRKLHYDAKRDSV